VLFLQPLFVKRK